MRELLTFDWCGKMAHFRKFYSNASALSHSLPPRTTILGLLASIAEIERDNYYIGTEYEVFNSLKIGVQIINSVRKINQKFNYLKIVKDGASEESLASELKDVYIFRGYSNRKQVSTELIVPQNIRQNDSIIRYRIFLGFPDEQHPIFDKLKENLRREYYPFGVCLGAANMLGYIEQPNGVEPIQFTTEIQIDNFVSVGSSIDENFVVAIDRESSFFIEHDLFPTSFSITNEVQGRIANETRVMLYSSDENPLRLKLKNANSIYFLPQLNQYINLI